MKTEIKARILTITMAALATVGLATAPASAKEKDTKKKSPAAAAASSASHIRDVDHAPKASEPDTKPGPAWKAVGGTVKQIDGNAYTVEDYEGNQVTLYVGQGTKQLRGAKKVGDTVRAEITRGGFANSVQ